MLLTALADCNIGLGWYSTPICELALNEISLFIQWFISCCGLDLQWMHLHLPTARKKIVFIGNPAFGGRGPSVYRKNQKQNATCKFDKTCGFPGEGWSNKFPNLTMGTWNTRSLTFERMQYCKGLNIDILAITELWRNQSKFVKKDKSFIISSPKLITTGPKKGHVRYPDDKASGVGILLSPTARSKVKSFGSEGERVCWARLAGPTCCLFVVAVYLPHRARTAPNQDDTLQDLENVLSSVPNGDCICVLGDFNEQLPSNTHGRTGHYTGGTASDNADKIIQFMQIHDLIAANTFFKPAQNGSVHTYLRTKRKGEGHDSPTPADCGQFVGDTVFNKYRGKVVKGEVKAMHVAPCGSKSWTVRFSDGHVKRYQDQKQLEKILAYKETEKVGSQLDYILVSARRKSCVQQCRPHWGPSIHRDLHGFKNDHALVKCTWKWRLRIRKKKPAKDFSCLYVQETDEHGNSIENLKLCAFNNAVTAKLHELNYSKEQDTTTQMHAKLCEAVTFAVNTVLPTRTKTLGTTRKVSAKTKDLFNKRRDMQGNKDQYAQVQKEIVASSLDDYQKWVRELVDEMETANAYGDTRKIYQTVKQIEAKPERPPANLRKDKNGKLLSNADEVATAWTTFLQRKFAATAAEQGRPEMQPLPDTKGAQGGILSYDAIIEGIKKMNDGKALGPDGIPCEIYKHSDVCRKVICELLGKIWTTEEVPVPFARASFRMLFKHKGSPDDPSKYRCIALLNHCYKILSQCMLVRLEKETKDYLSDWQAGFRKQRGCRDNVFVLRTIYDEMLARGEELFATFIDYSAAFDSVSHKFLDEALRDAGASNKTRAMFRAMYKAASANVKVADVDGNEILSQAFPVDRGVVQGDIVSPLYFILALELILKRHDNVADKGVDLAGRRIHTLGYADDAALLDNSIQKSTDRVTSIAAGSERDADMVISIEKTEVMQVCEQGQIPAATAAEAKATCNFSCPHLGCDRVFYNSHGMRCHAGKCKYRMELPVDRILEVRGATGSPRRKFKIRWKGYGPDDDTWEDRNNLHPDLINEFLLANDLYDHSWRGSRCPHCDKPCASDRGVLIHKRHCQMVPDDDQTFAGTKAAQKVRENKLADRQKQKPKAKCQEAELKNVFRFKYLGSIFAADGDHSYDVRRRVGLAMARMGQLRQVFSSDISFKLKLRLYKSAICSLFTYGSEAWALDENTRATINGANARCMNWITGRGIHVEASARTRTYDLVGAIRKRKYKWLGHILRMDRGRLVKHAAAVQFVGNRPGNIFMDAPSHFTYRDLEQLAHLRTRWRQQNFSPLPQQQAPAVSTNSTTRAARQRLAQNVSQRPATTLAEITNELPPSNPSPELATAMGPTTTTPTTMMTLQQPKRKAGKKLKSKGLSTEQRAAWAHAHYIVNHGTVDDALKFLKQTKTVANTPHETLAELKKMCLQQPPTWAEAEAAVFDSTLTSSSDTSSLWAEPVAAVLGNSHSDNNGTCSFRAEPAATSPDDGDASSSLWAEPVTAALNITFTDDSDMSTLAPSTTAAQTATLRPVTTTTTLPTWIEAKAAVFDSTISSCCSTNCDAPSPSETCSADYSRNLTKNKLISTPAAQPSVAHPTKLISAHQPLLNEPVCTSNPPPPPTTTTSQHQVASATMETTPIIQGHHQPLSSHLHKHDSRTPPLLLLSPIKPHVSVTTHSHTLCQSLQTGPTHLEWDTTHIEWNIPHFEWNKSPPEWNTSHALLNHTLQLTPTHTHT